MDFSDPRFNPKSDFYSKTFEVLLNKRDAISHDSYMFNFSFLDPTERLGLLVTQHLIINGQTLKGQPCRRKYTATSDFNQQGSFDIPIKIYRPNVHPNFPDGGELTPWLEHIPLGTKVTIRRALGKLIYLGQGHYLKPKQNFQKCQYDRVLMVCGGTGLTPAYQLIVAICKDPTDKTELTLLYANKTEEDILLRKELDELAAKHSDKFKLFYTLDKKQNENWKGFEGFVNLEMFKKVFPKIDQKTLGVLCGPKPMNKLVINLYQQLGLNESQILKF